MAAMSPLPAVSGSQNTPHMSPALMTSFGAKFPPTQQTENNRDGRQRVPGAARQTLIPATRPTGV